jgi:hypothetical protein
METPIKATPLVICLQTMLVIGLQPQMHRPQVSQPILSIKKANRYS